MESFSLSAAETHMRSRHIKINSVRRTWCSFSLLTVWDGWDIRHSWRGLKERNNDSQRRSCCHQSVNYIWHVRYVACTRFVQSSNLIIPGEEKPLCWWEINARRQTNSPGCDKRLLVRLQTSNFTKIKYLFTVVHCVLSKVKLEETIGCRKSIEQHIEQQH